MGQRIHPRQRQEREEVTEGWNASAGELESTWMRQLLRSITVQRYDFDFINGADLTLQNAHWALLRVYYIYEHVCCNFAAALHLPPSHRYALFGCNPRDPYIHILSPSSFGFVLLASDGYKGLTWRSFASTYRIFGIYAFPNLNRRIFHSQRVECAPRGCVARTAQ